MSCDNESCGTEEIEPHTCPYAVDLGASDEVRETTCRCCGDCEHQCATEV